MSEALALLVKRCWWSQRGGVRGSSAPRQPGSMLLGMGFTWPWFGQVLPVCFLLQQEASRVNKVSSFGERHCGACSSSFLHQVFWNFIFTFTRAMLEDTLATCKDFCLWDVFSEVWCCGKLCTPAVKHTALWVFPLSPLCLGEQLLSRILYQFHTIVISLTSVGFLVVSWSWFRFGSWVLQN